MNTKDIIQEQISTLVDDELSVAHIPSAFAALNGDEGRASWDLYHHIGDVLRSDEMALSLSPNFAASLSARLDAEPTIIAPVVVPAQAGRQMIPSALWQSSSTAKRFALPGMAVAATIAAFAFIASPQLMIAEKNVPQNGDTSMRVASSKPAGVSHVAVMTSSQAEGVILRDPQIDQYLSAHQRFSPSAYSIAQYARSATFATESSK